MIFAADYPTTGPRNPVKAARNRSETRVAQAEHMTSATISDPPAIEARGLVKTFGDFRVVDGVDLVVRRGEVFGVLEPNGAGKTTMLSMLATLLPIDEGEATIFGVDVRRDPHVVRQLLGVTGQYASVDELLTATENLVLFGRLQGVSRAVSKAAADRLLGQFHLQEAASKPIEQLSGGMRRRLDLAASLITRPPRGRRRPRVARPVPRAAPRPGRPAPPGRARSRRRGGSAKQAPGQDRSRRRGVVRRDHHHLDRVSR